MAVQKSRVTRSRRGMRRAHDAISVTSLSIDQMTGEMHRRHHIATDGYYKGEQVIEVTPKLTKKKTKNLY